MSSFLGLVGLDRNTQAGPSQYPADFSYSSSNNNYNNNNNYNQEEGGGLANTFLSFIGIKGKGAFIERVSYFSYFGLNTSQA